MKRDTSSLPVDNIEPLIRTIRGQKVILADDLARLYGVPTKRLNEQVKRNQERFPHDFMFQFSPEEAGAALRSRSQIATLKRGRNLKYLPYAFTENGAVISANILNSPQAVRMSVFVVRAFVKMRELAAELLKLEARLTARLDGHETAIFEVLQRVMDILNPPPRPPEPPRRQIGFHVPPEGAPPGKAKAGER